MSKLTLTGFVLPLFLLFASPQATAPKAFAATKESPEIQGQSGTLQKMIVESGSVTMDLDVSQLNGSAFIAGIFRACISLSRRIRSLAFLCSTMCCAALNRGPWHSFRKTLLRLFLHR